MNTQSKAEGGSSLVISEPKTNIVYTPEMMRIIASKASEHDAYKKTASTMKEKWSLVIEDLKQLSLFKEVSDKLNWNLLYAKFKREMAEAIEKAGIDKQYVNLSALAEEPDDYTLLLLTMAEEISEDQQEDVKKKEISTAFQARSDERESKQLAKGGKLTNANISLDLTDSCMDVSTRPPRPPVVMGSSDSKNEESLSIASSIPLSAKKGRSVSNGSSVSSSPLSSPFDSFSHTMDKLFSHGEAESLELEIKKRNFEYDLEEKQKKMALEEKMLESKLKDDEITRLERLARLEQDKQSQKSQEIMLKLMEKFLENK